MAKTKKISKVKGDIGRDHPGTTHEGNVKKKFKAKGMTCKNCELVIKKQVKTMPGVKKIDIDYATEEVQVIYDPYKINMHSRLKKSSYMVCPNRSRAAGYSNQR